MIDLKNISLLDILPENLKADENVRNAAKAIDTQLAGTGAAGKIRLALIISRIDELDDDVLDLLAWQFHADSYKSDYPLSTKRKLILQAIGWHKHKGTPWALKQVVSAIFDSANVYENWTYGGKPYHFKVDDITGGIAGADTIDELVKVINESKNVRSVLDSVGFKSDIPPGEQDPETGEYKNTSFFLAFALDQSKTIDLYPGIELNLDVTGKEAIGAAYLMELDQGATYGVIPEVTTITATAHPEIAMAWKRDIDIYPSQEVG